MKNPLLNQNFLRQLDLQTNKTLYAKIILLTWNEEPVEEIQGKITGGSINVDGASAVRRTCSLTMVSPKVDINNTYWALKNKFKLEIGVENIIDNSYPDIIWFKQGTYVFTSLNISVQSNNFTINISGKDKMCLLNGECGGTLNTSIDFGQLEEYTNSYKLIELSANDYKSNTYYYKDETGKYVKDRKTDFTAGRTYYEVDEIIRKIYSIPIVDIVKNAVHVYAGEPLHNIVINDVENYGLELLEYRGDSPMYMLRNMETGEIQNITFSTRYDGYKKIDENDLDNSNSNNFSDTTFYFTGENIIEFYNNTNFITDINANATSIWIPNQNQSSYVEHKVIRVTYGMVAGYRRTDLTYPGTLAANVGESLVSVLDKIKNMFADFEYFYDVDGRFIFQKKKTYVNQSWNPIENDDNEIYVAAAANTSEASYSFEDGVLLSAFTDAPAINNIKNDFSIWGKKKGSNGEDIKIHLRYAIDFKPEQYQAIEGGKQYISLDYTGATAREYVRCDWREIIYQMALDYFKYNHIKDNFTQLVAEANPNYYPTGITGYETYYTDMQAFWRQLYNPEAIDKNSNNEYWVEMDIVAGVGTGRFSSKNGFNENVSKYPETLNFWIDFMSTTGELGKYAVQTIGSRPKAINDDKVSGIYFKEVPNVLFISQGKEPDKNEMTGYTFINITPHMENYFSISAQGKSAWDELNNLLYQHTYASESVTLTSIPIYHLAPNTKIYVNDKNTGIAGEYILSKISVPLQYNGTSSLTTTKAVDRIY